MIKTSRVLTPLAIVVFLLGLAIPGTAQILYLSRENSGFIDNYLNRIVLFNGLPVICTDSGIAIIHPDHLETWRRGEAGFPDAGARDGAVHGGKLWIGTYGKGLARLEDGKWRNFSTENSGLINNYVTALMVLGNRLFVGTRDGLCVFDGFLWEKVGISSQPGIQITAMTVTGNTLWVGTSRGLFRLESGANPVFMEFENIPVIRTVAMEATGANLFVAHENGVLAILADGSKKFWGPDKLPTMHIHGFSSIENGVLCSTGMGIFLLTTDGNSRKFEFKGLNPALPSATVLSRSGGYFWVGLEGSGIVRIPETGDPLLSSLISSSRSGNPATSVSGNLPGTSAFPGLTNVSGGNSSGIVPIKVSEVKIFPPPTQESSAGSTGFITSSTMAVTRELSATWQPSRLGGTPNAPAPPMPSGTLLNAPSSAAPAGWSGTKLGAQANSSPTTAPTFISAAPVNATPLPSPQSAPPGWSATRLGSAGQPLAAAVPQGFTSLNTAPANPTQSAPAGWVAGKIGGTLSATPAPGLGTGLPTSGISFRQQVIPMLERACVRCHTSGPGNYFPLNNLPALASYLRTQGMARFDAASGQGRGMFNVYPPADADLLRSWLRDGAKD